MIPKDTIDSVLSAAKIEEVIGDYVSLKKKGINYVGCCPFHTEKTASMVVSPAKAYYHCFGCGKGGNVIGFVQDHELISFPDAVRKIAEKYNVQVPHYETSGDDAEYKQKEAIRSALKWASKFFNASTNVKTASEYFTERVISAEAIEEFNLGYAHPEWNTLEKAAAENGYSKDVLLAAGLIRKGERNTYDYFRDRIMFPFLDVTGNCIGFTGRDISGVKEIAKYQNSPDTELFSKGKAIYGLFQAKRTIVSEDLAYLVEGNIDVIRFAMMDTKNTVAGSGTAFTAQQVQLLKRFTNNVCVVYDGDKAGIKATFKNIDILLENGMNVKAVMLPEGEDPDSFGRKMTAEKLRQYLNKSQKDFITLKYELLKEDADDPAKISDIVKEILHSIMLIPDDITRHFYEQKCISKFGFSEKEVKHFIRTLQKKVPDKVDESRNGWIGLDFAADAIRENDECIITLNQQSLIDGICGANTGTVEEHTICHCGKIEQLHLQS
jgi:DNA primase